MKKLVAFIINLAIPIAVGGTSSIFTKNASEIYRSLELPSFAPPSAVFPIVWSILYALMGVSTYLIYSFGDKNKSATKKAFTIYALQLVLNFLWSVVFFGFELYWLAFVVIIILLVLIFMMIWAFYQENKFAAYLQIPYFIWVLFATILNLSIAIMN